MPLGPQTVHNPSVADGTTIPGLTEETVNIAGSMISSITDLDLNVYIGDERDIFFGYDTDFSLGISDDQEGLEVRNNLTGTTLLSLQKDNTTKFALADNNLVHLWQGNFAMTSRGAFIRY